MIKKEQLFLIATHCNDEPRYHPPYLAMTTQKTFLARRIFMDEDRLVRSLISYHWMYKIYSAYENADLISMIQIG